MAKGKRATKLNKSNVKQFGFMSQIDVEISDVLSNYHNIGNTIYWKNHEISELKKKIAGLEMETAQLRNQRAELLNELHDLFFQKNWHAPSLESVNHAMDEIVKFRQTVAPIDDNGDIEIEEK